jgi:hypothetical protein
LAILSSADFSGVVNAAVQRGYCPLIIDRSGKMLFPPSVC